MNKQGYLWHSGTARAVLRSVLFFALYSTQGIPAAVIDFHFRRHWRDAQMPALVDRHFYTIMYWPYLVRFMVAFVIEGLIPKAVPKKRSALFGVLHALLLGLAAIFVCCSFVTIQPVGDDIIARTLSRQLAMWATLALLWSTSAIAAASDVVLDALGFEAMADDGGDPSRNALQIIAFKTGKLVIQVFVSWLLVGLSLSWESCMLICAGVVCTVCVLSANVHTFTFSAMPRTTTVFPLPGVPAFLDASNATTAAADCEDSAPALTSHTLLHRMREGWVAFSSTAAAALAHLSASRLGYLLFAFAFTHKLGEMVFRDQSASFQDGRFRNQLALAAPTASEHAIIETQKAITFRLTNELGWIDLGMSTLPTLLVWLYSFLPPEWWACSSRRKASSGSSGHSPSRILFLSVLSVGLVRCLSLLRLAALSFDGSPILAAPPTATPPLDAAEVALSDWSSVGMVARWRWPYTVSASTTGLATSLFYILCMSGVQLVVAERPLSLPFRVSMYSLLEVTDDISRCIGAILSGVLLMLWGHPLTFAVGAILSAVPVLITLALLSALASTITPTHRT